MSDINDPTLGTWLVTGTGDNRRTIRQAISQLPRAVRLPKAQQMQHRRDIAELRQHPLAGLEGHPEASAIKNALRRRRQGRTRYTELSAARSSGSP